MKRNLLLGWISLFGVLAFAQEDSVVMRINGKEIPRSEFECSYRRHTDGNGTKLSPREYAELFILSKLKVEERPDSTLLRLFASNSRLIGQIC